MRVPQKTIRSFLKKIGLSYDPAIPLIGIYFKKMETGSLRDNGTPVFIAALFTKTKRWKQPKYPLLDEWILYKYKYIYIGMYYI